MRLDIFSLTLGILLLAAIIGMIILSWMCLSKIFKRYEMTMFSYVNQYFSQIRCPSRGSKTSGRPTL